MEAKNFIQQEAVSGDESDMQSRDNQEELYREQIEASFQRLLSDYMQSHHRQNKGMIEQAFRFADIAHAGQKRKSGEPYIIHPLAVATIVCNEMGLGSTSICAAILHDVAEDTEFKIPAIRKEFSNDPKFADKLCEIIDGLTKLSGGKFAEQSKQSADFLHLFVTMNKDIRVALIKLADRLHNMRTLNFMRPDKQMKIVGETTYIFIPLAHRLGLYAIKTELENLCLKYEHPDAYNEIDEKLKAKEPFMSTLFEKFAKPIDDKLQSLGINYVMTKRVKSHYSIWKKMTGKNLPFEEIYDLFAVRIVFDSQENVTDKDMCLRIYSAITDIYKHPQRFRDYVSFPKTNGYRSLHLTVMGPEGQWFEIQIRSRIMDDIDENGLAAHWKYKRYNIEEDPELKRWLDTIKKLLENPTPNIGKYFDGIIIAPDDIEIFTPKGDCRILPKGSSALDFAYDLHSNIGDHALAAKVNHRSVSVNYKLRSGDQVEIITSKSQNPDKEWLGFVVTPKAISDINAALKHIRKESAQEGKKILLEAFSKAGIDSPQSSILDKVAAFHGFTDREDLYVAISKGDISDNLDIKKILRTKTNFLKLITRIRTQQKKDKESPSKKAHVEEAPKFDRKKPFTLTDEKRGIDYVLMDCCNPIPGDETVGFIDMDKNQLQVHKRNCKLATVMKATYGDLIVATIWDKRQSFSFEATISITGIDAVGMLGTISLIISGFNVNILKLAVETSEGIFSGTIKMRVHNTEDVQKLCEELSKVDNIMSVHRISE